MKVYMISMSWFLYMKTSWGDLAKIPPFLSEKILRLKNFFKRKKFLSLRIEHWENCYFPESFVSVLQFFAAAVNYFVFFLLSSVNIFQILKKFPLKNFLSLLIVIFVICHCQNCHFPESFVCYNFLLQQ